MGMKPLPASLSYANSMRASSITPVMREKEAVIRAILDEAGFAVRKVYYSWDRQRSLRMKFPELYVVTSPESPKALGRNVEDALEPHYIDYNGYAQFLLPDKTKFHSFILVRENEARGLARRT